MFSRQQAQLIMEAHEVFSLLEDEEEIALLEENNPELLEAYCALHRFAVGARDPNGNLVCESAEQSHKPCTCDGRCDGFCLEGKEKGK